MIWHVSFAFTAVLWLSSRHRQMHVVYAHAGGRLWQIFCSSDEFGLRTASRWPVEQPPIYGSCSEPSFPGLATYGMGADRLVGPVWLNGDYDSAGQMESDVKAALASAYRRASPSHLQGAAARRTGTGGTTHFTGLPSRPLK